MPQRIQINEPIQVRELPDMKGTFGIYSTEKNEYLALNEKPIVLDKKNPPALVLPETHALKNLDLLPRDPSGKEMKATLPSLIIENQGDRVELKGNDLTIVGPATIRTTVSELAGIKITDQKVSATSNQNRLHRLHQEGAVFTYGEGKKVAVLDPPLKGRVDFTDGNSKDTPMIFTFASGEDQGVLHGRTLRMQQRALEQVRDALKKPDKDQLKNLGLRDDLPGGNYTIRQMDSGRKWQETGKDEDTVEEKAAARRFFRDMPPAVLPDNRERAKLAPDSKEKTPSPTALQSAFNAELGKGLDPQAAMAMAADHNSVETPSGIPGGSGGRGRIV